MDYATQSFMKYLAKRFSLVVYVVSDHRSACAVQPLSPMECHGSSWCSLAKPDIDDTSRDSGISCDSMSSSPSRLVSPARKLTPARRLDFSGLLSPSDTVRLN